MPSNINEFKNYDLVTQDAIAYMQSLDNFAAGKAISNVSVQNFTGTYRKWALEDLIRDEFAIRADGADYAKDSGDTISKPTFACEEYAKEFTVGEREKATYGNADALIEKKIQKNIRQGLIKRERIYVDRFMTAGKWANADVDLTSTKFTADTTDPFKLIETHRADIGNKTGLIPNIIVATEDVARAIRYNAVVRALLPTDTLRLVKEDELAKLFDVDKFVIMRGVYNTAKKANVTQSIVPIATSKLLLQYDPLTNDVDDASAGKLFTPSTEKVNPLGFEIRQKEDEYHGRTQTALKMFFDMQIACPDLAKLMINCV